MRFEHERLTIYRARAPSPGLWVSVQAVLWFPDTARFVRPSPIGCRYGNQRRPILCGSSGSTDLNPWRGAALEAPLANLGRRSSGAHPRASDRPLVVRQDFESLVAICEYDLIGRVLINTVGKRGSLNVRFAPKFVAAK